MKFHSLIKSPINLSYDFLMQQATIKNVTHKSNILKLTKGKTKKMSDNEGVQVDSKTKKKSCNFSPVHVYNSH